MRRVSYVCVTILAAAAANPAERLAHEIVGILEDVSGLTAEPWRMRVGTAYGAEQPGYDDSTWESVSLDMPWMGLETEARPPEVWYRSWLVVPDRIGAIPIHRSDITLRSWLHAGEAEVWVDGVSVLRLGCGQGPCTKPEQAETVVARDIRPGQRLLLAINVTQIEDPDTRDEEDVQEEWKRWTAPIQIRLTFSETTGFQQICEAALPKVRLAEAILNLPPSEGETQWRRTFGSALNSIDIAALETKDLKAFEDSLGLCLASLHELEALTRQYKVSVINLSNSAWLWNDAPDPVSEERETDARAILSLLGEFPDSRVSQTQAALHDALQYRSPDTHSALKQEAVDGRYDASGGSWTFFHPGLVSGESILRQFLYGAGYFREEMDVPSRVAVLPDTCAYTPSLAGLLTGCGIESLMILPSHPQVGLDPESRDSGFLPSNGLFWWESADGIRILTYIPPGGIRQNLRPLPLIRQFDEYLLREGVSDMAIVCGKYGGRDASSRTAGWRPAIDLAYQAVHLRDDRLFPVTEPSTISAWFDRLHERSKQQDYPVWRGDLADSLHTGTFTSAPRLAQALQAAESALLRAERFAVIASRLGLEMPADSFDESWTALLGLQANPQLCGLAPSEARRQAEDTLGAVRLSAEETLDEALAEIGADINTSQLQWPLIVHNPVSWVRDGFIEIAMPPDGEHSISKARVTDVLGTEIPCQVRIEDEHRVILLVDVRDVPPTGYTTLQVYPDQSPAPKSEPLKVEKTVIENRWYRLELDRRGGYIRSLLDKTNNQQVFGPNGGARWQILTAAWSPLVSWRVRPGRPTEVGPARMRVVEKGPLRASIEVTHTVGEDRLVQTFSLRSGSPIIDVGVEVDWHTPGRLVSLTSDLGFPATQLTCGIPYGHVVRDSRQPDIPGSVWVDAGADKRPYGLAMINADRFGHGLDGGLLSLNVLRAPPEAPAVAGQSQLGRHEFKYRLLPHGNDWRVENIPRRAMELLDPLYARWESVHVGNLRTMGSWLDVSGGSAVCTAWKPAQDVPGAVVLRLHEVLGEESESLVTLPAEAVEVVKTGHLEQNPIPVSFTGQRFRVQLQPNEVATYMARYAGSVD